MGEYSINPDSTKPSPFEAAIERHHLTRREVIWLAVAVQPSFLIGGSVEENTRLIEMHITLMRIDQDLHPERWD